MTVAMDEFRAVEQHAAGPHFDVSRLKQGEVSMGTTICAIKYRDGVVLAADSRTTSGSLIANRVTDKLTQLHDRIWCCRSGSAADTQAVADILSYHLGSYEMQFAREPTTQVAANLASELCYTNRQALSAGLIVAGFDSRAGGSVYSIPLGGSLHKQDMAVSGSGSTYIMGFLDKSYRADMTKDEAVELLKNAIALAMERDGSSGGVIRMVSLTKDGIERFFFADKDIPLYFNRE